MANILINFEESFSLKYTTNIHMGRLNSDVFTYSASTSINVHVDRQVNLACGEIR
jgi:hypothetical protein